MRTVSGILSLSLLFVYSSFGQITEPRTKVKEVSYSTRTVTVEKSTLTKKNGKWVEGQRKPENSSTYSLNGKLIEDTSYSTEGRQTRTFNESEKVVEEIRYNLAGAIEERQVHTYAPDGEEKAIFIYDSKGNLKYKYLHFKDNKTLASEDYNYSTGEETYTGKTIYTFDDRGRILEMNRFDAAGKIGQKRISQYDDVNGTEESLNYVGTNLISRRTTLFNAKNEPIETSTFDSDGTLLLKVTTTHDGERTITEIIHNNRDGSLDKKEISVYDEKDDLIEDSAYKSDGSLINKFLYEYEFDSKGNIAKEKRSILVPKDGKLVVESVEITYYTETYQ